MEEKCKCDFTKKTKKKENIFLLFVVVVVVGVFLVAYTFIHILNTQLALFISWLSFRVDHQPRFVGNEFKDEVSSFGVAFTSVRLKLALQTKWSFMPLHRPLLMPLATLSWYKHVVVDVGISLRFVIPDTFRVDISFSDALASADEVIRLYVNTHLAQRLLWTQCRSCWSEILDMPSSARPI